MGNEPPERTPSSPLPLHQNEAYWSLVARQFRKHRIAVIGLWVVLVLFAVALMADFIANDKPLVLSHRGRIFVPIVRDYAVWLGVARWQPEFLNISYKDFVVQNSHDVDWVIFPPIRFSPNDIDLKSAIHPPSRIHFLGTDEIGRDIASRMVHGSRVSMSVGFVAVSIYVLIGIIIGALAGYYGGVVDIVASRLIEIILTIPTFFLIITRLAFLRQSIFNIMVVIGITNWPTLARLTRGDFL